MRKIRKTSVDMVNKEGIFYGVGIGPGDPELITLKALKRIEDTAVICAPRTKNEEMLALSIIDQVVDLSGKMIIPIDTDMERDPQKRQEKYQTQALQLSALLESGKDVAMINIGDVSIYSTVSYMAEALKVLGHTTVMIPGVPSFCAVAAALNESLTTMHEPLHVIPASSGTLEDQLALPGTKILMKSGKKLKQTLQVLAAEGKLQETSLVANCGMPDEVILKSIDPDTKIPDQAGYFTTVIVKEMKKHIKIATRGSKLALAQAELVAAQIHAQGYTTEYVIVKTHGDKDQKSALSVIGGNGLFVREVEQALLDGRADIAVHSGKDLPYQLQEGLVIAGVPKAADPADCLIRRAKDQDMVPKTIGTGSPRRIAYCQAMFPESTCVQIRGNVDTRLKKLANGEYDAIMLARAGLDRLNPDLSAFSCETLAVDQVVPAACQGILAIECRQEDEDIRRMLERLSDEVTRIRFDIERYMMCCLQADCKQAVAVHATLFKDQFILRARYGSQELSAQGNCGDHQKICQALAETLIRSEDDVYR